MNGHAASICSMQELPITINAVCAGPTMYVGQIRTYVLLVHRCRRFFPDGADQEIWDECCPALPHVFASQSFEVRTTAFACIGSCDGLDSIIMADPKPMSLEPGQQTG